MPDYCPIFIISNKKRHFGAFCFYNEVPFEKQLHCWSNTHTLVSGSPILRNGKLIGAVTHVLVNDPTTGYGIFIENMLDAAA